MKRPTDDFDERQLSSPAGEGRSTSALGDQLIVGLAALVLLAGVVIAGGNLLKNISGEDETASASATPLPSGATPARTSRPTATPRPPREVTVVERTPYPTPDTGQDQSPEWLEAVGEVSERTGPDDSYPVLNTWPAGSVLVVTADAAHPGWVRITDPEGGFQMGWIATADAEGNPVAVLHPADVQPSSGDVWQVEAAGGRYWAMGTLPADPGDVWAPRLFVSPDGEHWAVSEAGLAGQWDGVMGIADGPSGLLAITSLQSGNELWLLESSDGRSWRLVGELRGVHPGWPNDMVGSDLGYLINVGDSGPNSSTVSLWYSPDGIAWHESRVAFPPGGYTPVRVLAVEHGFVAWLAAWGLDDGTASIAFSPDGRSWVPVQADDPGFRGQLELAASGATLLGVTTTEDRTVRAWRADLTAPTAIRLVRDWSAEAVFGALRAVQLVSDGRQTFLLGYGASDDQPRLFANEGGSWRGVSMPERAQLGPTARLGTVGPNGLVLIGTRPTAAGGNPIFWHRRPDGSWAVEREPVIPLQPDPGPAQCGSLPTTALEFALLPTDWGPICFGDQPITVTAWSAPCDWCDPGSNTDGTPPDGTPAWLMRGLGDVQLQPAEGGAISFTDGYFLPGLTAQGWRDQWVRVTGHYADPASATCAWGPDNADPFYDSPETAVAACRQRFVITAIQAADGPLLP